MGDQPPSNSLPSAQKQTPPLPSYKQTQNNLLKPPGAPQKQPIAHTAGKVGKSHHEYMKVMNSSSPTQNFRKITAEQLSHHRTKQSAWLSLGGVVYDVTVYQNYHPGGNVILEGCGIECTDLFNQHHPWVNAKYLLDKYKIGYLSK